ERQGLGKAQDSAPEPFCHHVEVTPPLGETLVDAALEFLNPALDRLEPLVDALELALDCLEPLVDVAARLCVARADLGPQVRSESIESVSQLRIHGRSLTASEQLVNVAVRVH